jgi:hypothetical protein
LSEFDVRQGAMELIVSFSVESEIWIVFAVHCAAALLMAANLEFAVILEQLLLGILIVALVVLLLPFLLVMAGVGAAMLLWFVASAAVLGALVFWLVFLGTYGLAVLLLALVIGLLLVDRQSRHGAS